MKRYMAVCLSIVALIFSGNSCIKKNLEPAIKQNDASVIFFLGDVQVKNADQWQPVTEQMKLKQGNEIKTGPLSECNIIIGTDSYVSIKEKSLLVIDTLLRDVAGLEDNALELRVGKGVINPRKLLKGDSFTVKTPTAIAAVRGTKFVIETDPEGEMKVAVVDGKVEMKRRIPALEQLEDNLVKKSETLTELKQKVDQESIVIDANQTATIDNKKTTEENLVIEKAIEKHVDTLKKLEEKPQAEAAGEQPVPGAPGEVTVQKPQELVEMDKSLSVAISGLEIMQEKKKEEPVQIKLEQKVEEKNIEDVKQLDNAIEEHRDKQKQQKTDKPVTRLSINTPVAGSAIYVNDKLAAYDSATLTPDPGKELKILVRAAGYAPFESSVVLEEGEHKTVEVKYLENGKITIISPVLNSQIFVAGTLAGKDQVTVEQAPGQSVEVRIKARDFKDYTEQVILAPGEAKEITAVMEREKALDRVKWSRRMGTDVSVPPVYVNNLVILTTSDGYVTVVNRDGQNIWRANLRRRIESTPVYSNGHVYVVTSSGDFFALSFASGETQWKQNIFGSLLFGASPLVVNHVIYVASSYGRIYAFNESGKELWKRDIENGIYTTPAFYNNRLYFGAEDYNLYALSSDRGEILWRFKADSRTVASSPVVSGNTLYFGCYSGYFYAIDSDSGKEKWKFKAGDSIFSTALIRDGAVYFGSNDGNLYSLNESDGKVRWKYHSGSRVGGTPAFDNGVIYVTSGRRLCALAPDSGNVLWSHDFPGRVKTSATVSGTDIFVCLENGEVASVRNSLFNVYR